MGWIAPVAGAAVGIARGGRKRPNNRQAIAELRASQPTGYLTDADLRAAELTRGRLASGARAQGELAGVGVTRRATARGLAGSPSQERDLARVGQQTALGVEGAGNSAEEQLYNIRQGREAYGQQKDLAIFQAQVGQNQQEAARQQAENGAFWNSLTEFMPAIMGGIDAPANVAGGGMANNSRTTGYTPEQVPKGIY